jgi:hypothetical protein
MGCVSRRMRPSVMCSICILCCGVCFGQQNPTVPVASAAGTVAQTSSAQVVPTQPPAAQTTPAQDPQAQSSPAPLPDAPSLQTDASTSAAPQTDEQQTKRIMGILPNFRSVTAGEVVPPETTRQKLVTATEDNFDYTSLFFAGIIAGDSFMTKATPEFHQGAAGYARYYWHTVADQGIENYFVELIYPAVTHEDSRYYAMGREGGCFWKRAGYSLSRVVVTKKDSGESTFNISEIAGSATAASISNFYYPTKEQTVGNGLRNWGLDITYDAITFAFHEFWPDISHAVFSKKSKTPATTP